MWRPAVLTYPAAPPCLRSFVLVWQTCAVMATMHARGQLGLNEPFIHESIVGSKFTGMLSDETTVGARNAVSASISGQAWITQYSHVVSSTHTVERSP